MAKGYTQSYGIDYFETFVPVAKMTTVRILISLVAHFGCKMHQLDVKNVFLHGDLEKEVYMEMPPRFQGRDTDTVCKLKKALYGFKQSLRAWFDKFSKAMKSMGYVHK